jgi:2'-5' RNA ligase
VRWSARAEVETLDLMRSTLAPGGSRYELLHAAPLGER